VAKDTILGTVADRWTRRLVLALTLALSCVVGLITPYLLGAVSIVLFVALAIKGQLIAIYDGIEARLFLAAFVVLAASFALTAHEPQDALSAFNFAMLVLFAPLHALMARGAGMSNAAHAGEFALAGTAISLVGALIGTFLFGWGRAEGPHFGAVLLANTTLLLSFLSLMGLASDKKQGRWRYGLAPLLGVVVIGLTGSRGPLVAFIPLLVVAAIFASRILKVRPLVTSIVAVGYTVVCAVVVLGMQTRSASLVGVVGEMAGGAAARIEGEDVTPIADVTADLRLSLYEAGIRAFLEAPWLGHGWKRLMSAAWPYLPEDKAPFMNLPQLHNDVINFGVAAGVVGIGVYVLLIATPLIAAWRSPRDSQYEVRLFGCMILCTAYVFDGLTDLMFGFEFHTALYVCISAILLGYCRDPVVHAALADGPPRTTAPVVPPKTP
jgi:O-antigen ligase